MQQHQSLNSLPTIKAKHERLTASPPLSQYKLDSSRAIETKYRLEVDKAGSKSYGSRQSQTRTQNDASTESRVPNQSREKNSRTYLLKSNKSRDYIDPLIKKNLRNQTDVSRSTIHDDLLSNLVSNDPKDPNINIQQITNGLNLKNAPRHQVQQTRSVPKLELVSEESFNRNQQVRDLIDQDSFSGKLHNLNHNSADLRYEVTLNGLKSLPQTSKTGYLKELSYDLRSNSAAEILGSFQREIMKKGFKTTKITYQNQDRKRDDLIVLKEWFHLQMSEIKKKQDDSKKASVLDTFDLLQHLYGTTMKELARQISLGMKEYGDFMEILWKMNDEMMDQVVSFLKTNYIDQKIHYLKESSHYHQEYQDNIDVELKQYKQKLNETIAAQKIDINYYKEHYRKQVETDRYIRKKAVKLEKKNKIIEYELKDIIQQYEELKVENFKLNTAIQMMDEADELKLRQKISAFYREQQVYQNKLMIKQRVLQQNREKDTQKKYEIILDEAEEKLGSRLLSPKKVDDSADIGASVDEELENEIFIKNNADILDISTEIVEVGVNTSLKYITVRDTLDTQNDTGDLRRQYYSNHKEIQVRMRGLDAGVQCELPILSKRIFERTEKFQDKESETLQQIITSADHYPTQIKEIANLFQVTQKQFKIELQKVFSPPVESKFCGLQKLLIEFFQKLEETFRSIDHKLHAKDSELSQLREQNQLIIQDIDIRESRLTKLQFSNRQLEEQVKKLQENNIDAQNQVEELTLKLTTDIRDQKSLRQLTNNQKQLSDASRRSTKELNLKKTDSSSPFQGKLLQPDDLRLNLNIDQHFNGEEQDLRTGGVSSKNQPQKKNQTFKFTNPPNRQAPPKLTKNNLDSQKEKLDQQLKPKPESKNPKVQMSRSTRKLFEPKQQSLNLKPQVQPNMTASQKQISRATLSSISDEDEGQVQIVKDERKRITKTEERQDSLKLMQQSIPSNQQKKTSIFEMYESGSQKDDQLSKGRSDSEQNPHKLNIKIQSEELNEVREQSMTLQIFVNSPKKVESSLVNQGEFVLRKVQSGHQSDENPFLIEDDKVSQAQPIEQQEPLSKVTSSKFLKTEANSQTQSRPLSTTVPEPFNLGNRGVSRINYSKFRNEDLIHQDQQKEKKYTQFKPFHFFSASTTKRRKKNKYDMKHGTKEAFQAIFKSIPQKQKVAVSQQAIVKMDHALGPVKKTLYQIFNELIEQYKKGDEMPFSLDIITYDWFLHTYGIKKIAEKKLISTIEKLQSYDLGYYPLLQVILNLYSQLRVKDLQVFLRVYTACESVQKMHVQNNQQEEKSPLISNSLKFLRDLLFELSTSSVSFISQLLAQFFGKVNHLVQADPNLQNQIVFCDHVSKMIFDSYQVMVDYVRDKQWNNFGCFFKDKSHFITLACYKTIMGPLYKKKERQHDIIKNFFDNCDQYDNNEGRIMSFGQFALLCEQDNIQQFICDHLNIYESSKFVLTNKDQLLTQNKEFQVYSRQTMEYLGIQNPNFECFMQNLGQIQNTFSQPEKSVNQQTNKNRNLIYQIFTFAAFQCSKNLMNKYSMLRF